LSTHYFPDSPGNSSLLPAVVGEDPQNLAVSAFRSRYPERIPKNSSRTQGDRPNGGIGQESLPSQPRMTLILRLKVAGGIGIFAAPERQTPDIGGTAGGRGRVQKYFQQGCLPPRVDLSAAGKGAIGNHMFVPISAKTTLHRSSVRVRFKSR